ncbi:DUF21 domain-containing protein [bacterium]|nr:DUF21 domain-containing protein [bacterium]
MTYLIVVALLLLSALFSGMNLGLMSLDPHELERKIALGDARAAKIFPLRRRGNLLLVTLLIGNVAVNSTLAIFMGSIAVGVVAVLVSTALITILGEIIPQALFSRYALSVGSKLAGIVRFFVIVLWPICAPIAWVLDKIFGDELPTVYSKTELLKIVEEHRRSEHSDVDTDEQRIIKGALSFSERLVNEVMTPRSMMVAIEEHTPLTTQKIEELQASGQSRIPVYDTRIDTVVGMLYMRDLVGVTRTQKTAGDLCREKVFFIHEHDSLDDALNQFLKTHHHLFIVVNDFAEVEGVLSIEDVLEAIIHKEIVDEFDKYHDMRAVAKKRAHESKPKIG